MKLMACLPSRWILQVFISIGLLGPWLGVANGQTPYKAGDIVTTNLTLQNRLRWTNDAGRVFTPSNTVIRLSDFDGKIVFFTFFDVW